MRNLNARNKVEKGEEKQSLTGTAEVLPEILISEDEDTNQVIFRRTRTPIRWFSEGRGHQLGDFQKYEETNQVIFRRTRNQSGDFQKDEDTNQVIF